MDNPKYIEFELDGAVAVARFQMRDFCNTFDVRACGEELGALCAESCPRDLIVDFDGMGVVPSSVFASLVLIYKRLKEKGGRLHVCSLGKEALGAFYVLNLQRLMTVHATRDEAVTAARALQAKEAEA